MPEAMAQQASLAGECTVNCSGHEVRYAWTENHGAAISGSDYHF